MGEFVTCSACRGQKSLAGEQVPCPTCQGSRTVRASCPRCAGTCSIKCKVCDGTGSGSWLFLRRPCDTCSAKGFLPCPSCQGQGFRLDKCGKCSGMGAVPGPRIPCVPCGASGKVKNPWLDELKELPPDRLQFEYERRQRLISSLKGNLQEKRRELDDLYDWYEEDKERRPQAYNAAGTEPCGLHDIPREMDNIEASIRDTEEDLSTILFVIERKWK